MRIHPKYIQLIGDSVIPLLGFFFWNWNLYFILIFYFLDLVTKEVLLHLKSRKIQNFKKEEAKVGLNNESTPWIKFAITSILLFVFCVVLVQLSMPFIQPDFICIDQLIRFWTYKDMGGIEQGYIFLPLIIFMGYTQYKMEFLKPLAFMKTSIKDLWAPHLRSVVVIFGCIAFSFGLVHFISIPEFVFVIGIVVISSIFQYLQLKKNT